MASGLTSRATLDKLSGIQVLDFHFSNTDVRDCSWDGSILLSRRNHDRK